MNIITVHAETTGFYEAEFIDNIYVSKYQYSTNTIYYQKAKFFRKYGTNEFAYCIEPFTFFKENSEYYSDYNPNHLSEDKIQRIIELAHFGYGYKDHTDNKWYAITQLLIWKEADSSGDFYFTDGANGPRINIFEQEINELNQLIENYNKKPSFINENIKIIEDTQKILIDENNILEDYTINNENITIGNNSLIINNLKEGEYNISLTKNDNYYNKPVIFYNSYTSQNLVIQGDYNKNDTLRIKVEKSNLEITKIDADTNKTTPLGEAALDGAIYNLYNEEMKKISEVEIKNNTASINNLDYGKYYIKEEKPGEGYLLDDETYEFEIKDNLQIKIILKNKVIDKNITIIKQYGENNTYNNEQNISFEIYNKDKLFQTITTNEEGKISIKLPYGTYKIKQLNTTDGYEKIEDFSITINNTEDETIVLKDNKIKVPNTYKEIDIYKILTNLLKLLVQIICII